MKLLSVVTAGSYIRLYLLLLIPVTRSTKSSSFGMQFTVPATPLRYKADMFTEMKLRQTLSIETLQ